MGVDFVGHFVSSAPSRNNFDCRLSSATLSHAAETTHDGAADSPRLQRSRGATAASKTRPKEKEATGKEGPRHELASPLRFSICSRMMTPALLSLTTSASVS